MAVISPHFASRCGLVREKRHRLARNPLAVDLEILQSVSGGLH